MTAVQAHPRAHPKHAHDDTPDTSGAFRRIAELPDGSQKEALREEVVQGLDADGRAHRLAVPQPR